MGVGDCRSGGAEGDAQSLQARAPLPLAQDGAGHAYTALLSPPPAPLNSPPLPFCALPLYCPPAARGGRGAVAAAAARRGARRAPRARRPTPIHPRPTGAKRRLPHASCLPAQNLAHLAPDRARRRQRQRPPPQPQAESRMGPCRKSAKCQTEPELHALLRGSRRRRRRSRGRSSSACWPWAATCPRPPFGRGWCAPRQRWSRCRCRGCAGSCRRTALCSEWWEGRERDGKERKGKDGLTSAYGTVQ